MGFTTVALVGLALQTYGAIKSAHDAKKAGEAQTQAAESEASIAEYNAGVADLQAKDAVRGLVGSQRAGVAAGNIDVGYGSAVDVQADAAYLGELDARAIRSNAAREAWGYQVQATDLRTRAKIARKTGYYAGQAAQSTANTAYLKAGANIALSTATLLQQRYGYNTSTPPPITPGNSGFVAERDQFEVG